jgi:hypothetical protein
MTETTNDPIKVGDQVAYRTAEGASLGVASGKVLGIFRTMDGKTLADIEWNRLGMSKRVSIERLTKIVVND